MSKATFAMGCFWAPEMCYRNVDGVTDAAVGYAGGHVDNPTYRQVCQGDTGHAEVVQVEYDPDKVSYAQLLDVFWANHDPTTSNRPAPDAGSQYRSAIFTHDHAQAEAARASLARRRVALSREIVTRIGPLEVFYRAEAFHQRYLEHGGGVCH